MAGRNLEARHVQRAVELSKEKYCSATIMLAETVDITATIEIVDADRLPASA